VAFADGGSSASVGGEIGGYIAVTTIDLPGVRASLDAVARGLATAVNAQHSAGTGLDGSTGNAFFSGTDAATLAVSPSLVPAKIAASAGGAANDGNNALALFRVSTNTTAVTLPGGAPTSIGDALRALGGRLGSLASGAAAVAKTTSTAVDSATKTRSSQNGVSIDEEMVDLVKYQHAYSAAAKVVSTADQMLDTLINRLGV
jgi:flagellar hook-associated protein 1 FlgK